VRVSPRYEGPSIIEIEGSPGDQLAPMARQRRRLARTLDSLTAREWEAPSRCAGWSVRDVVAHLAGVNPFWSLSIAEGLAGRPTRYLTGFDPVATPAQMVEAERFRPADEVLAAFVATNEALLGQLAGLTDERWSSPAEAPPGHLPIRLVASHALWDAWVHERDVCAPLARPVPVEPDEVASALRYAAALSAAFALTADAAVGGRFALVATDPAISFVVEVTDAARVSSALADPRDPVLRGDAVELLEVLSQRAPVAKSAPAPWRELVGALATVFDADARD
jgi:uncharacterized protein (TIGR03083 family)